MITTIANTIQEHLSATGYIVSQGLATKMFGEHSDIVAYVKSLQQEWCCTIVYSEQSLTLIPACSTTHYNTRSSIYDTKTLEYAHPDLIMNLVLTINNYNLAQNIALKKENSL